MFSAYIRSVVEYNSPLYVGLNTMNNKKLSKIAKLCRRITCGGECDETCFGSIKERHEERSRDVFNGMSNEGAVLYHRRPTYFPEDFILRIVLKIHFLALTVGPTILYVSAQHWTVTNWLLENAFLLSYVPFPFIYLFSQPLSSMFVPPSTSTLTLTFLCSLSLLFRASHSLKCSNMMYLIDFHYSENKHSLFNW